MEQPRNLGDKTAKLRKHYPEDLLDITKTKIKQAMGQMSNNKCPGPVEIMVEMIKVGMKNLKKQNGTIQLKLYTRKEINKI